MKKYTFRNTSNGAVLTVEHMNYESAMYEVCEMTNHPVDWVLMEQDGHTLTINEVILNTVNPVNIDMHGDA